MTTRLDSLVVSAALDASAYTQGAAQKVAADQSMIDSAKAVDTSTTTTQQKLGVSSSAIDRLTRSLDPAAASSAKFASGQATVQRAVDQGRISTDQAANLMSLLTQRYSAGGAAVGAFGAAHNDAIDKVEGLRYSVRLFSDTLSGRYIGVAENAAFVANHFGLLAAAMNPVTIGAASIAAAFIGLALHADTVQTESNRLGVALTAVGKDSQISAGQLEGLITNMQRLGVSHANALASITGAARVPGATFSDISSAAAAAPNFSSAFGVNIDLATKQLTEMGAQGYAAIRKLDDAYNLLTPDQLAHIRLLVEEGNQAGAVAAVFAAAAARDAGAWDASKGAATDAITTIKNAWSDLVDFLAKAAVGTVTIAINSGIQTGQATTDLGKQFGGLYSTFLGKPFSSALSYLTGGNLGTNYYAPNAASSPGAFPAGVEVPTGMGPQPISAASSFPQPIQNPNYVSDPKSIDALNKEVELYGRLSIAMQANVGIRTIEIAKVQAVQEAFDKQLVAGERDELVTLRVAQAHDKLTQAANDNLKSIQAETAGLLTVAQAYSVSDAAGNDATANMQAANLVRQNSAYTESVLAQKIKDRAAAQSLVDLTKSVNQMNDQVAASNALIDAEGRGTQAAQAATAELANEVTVRKALSAATADTIGQVLMEVSALDKDTLALTNNAKAKENKTAIDKATNDVQISAMQAHAAQISDPTLRNAADIQIQRQQEINDLTLQYGSIIDEVAAKRLALWDQNAANRDQARYWTDVQNQAKTTSDDIKNFLVDGFTGVNNQGKSIFQNLWDGALAGAKRLAINIIATFAEQEVIIPIVTQIVGSTSSLFGIAGTTGSASNIAGVAGVASGASGAGGGMSLISNLLGGVPLLTGSFDSPFLAGIGGSIANSIGASTGLGSALVNGFDAAPFGIIGGLLASLTGLGGNGIASTLLSGAGSIGGGVLGSLVIGGSVGGPIGAIAGAFLGSILGGLFGGGKSVGPNADATITYDQIKNQFGLGGVGADNGDTTANVTAAANEAITALNQLLTGLNLTVKPGAVPAFGGIADTGLAGSTFFPSSGGYVTNLLTSHALTSTDPVMAAILQNTKATDLAGITADLQFGQQFEQLAGQAQDASTAITQANAAVKQITDQFDTMRTTALALGLPLDQINKVEANQLQALQDQVNQTIQGIKTQVDTGLGIPALTQFQTSLASSNLSPLSPTDQFNAAKSAYDQISAQAQGGDLNSIASFPGAAQNLLTQGRSFYGSSQAYADLFTAVNTTLNDVLQKQRQTETSILGDLGPTIQQSSQNIIDGFKKEIAPAITSLQAIERALRAQIATGTFG